MLSTHKKKKTVFTDKKLLRFMKLGLALLLKLSETIRFKYLRYPFDFLKIIRITQKKEQNDAKSYLSTNKLEASFIRTFTTLRATSPACTV